jgi:transcription termination/antitermination protein NusG
MDMQEPEERRLEDEPIEPAEDVSTSSDEPVLSDADASEADQEPAPVSPLDEEAEETPVVTELDEETVPEASMEEDAEAEAPEEAPAEEAVPETLLDNMVEAELDKVSAIEKSIEDVETDAVEKAPEPEQDDDPSDWFVIHCYSGYENKVRHNLEQRIETMGMKDMIFDVVVPTQEEIEVRDGKRRTVERHIFPGYVLVNLILTEESWYVVRNTPGVTGFVGMGNNPTPLRPEEVAQIVKRMEADAPTVKVTFKVGERVRIIDGPFNDFRGVVSEIDMERTKVRVMVSFFGRETPVELDFLQVEKA